MTLLHEIKRCGVVETSLRCVELEFGRIGWRIVYEHPGYIPSWLTRLRVRLSLTVSFLRYVWSPFGGRH